MKNYLEIQNAMYDLLGRPKLTPFEFEFVAKLTSIVADVIDLNDGRGHTVKEAVEVMLPYIGRHRHLTRHHIELVDQNIKHLEWRAERHRVEIEESMEWGTYRRTAILKELKDVETSQAALLKDLRRVLIDRVK